MTDPTTPPAYGAPAPAPAPAPAAEPAKKKSSAGRIIGIVIAVLLVGGGIVYRFVLPAIEDAKFKVGACLDVIPLTNGSTVDPNVVDCSSAEARSEIIAVVDGATAASAATQCPENWIAALERKGKLLCLIEA